MNSELTAEEIRQRRLRRLGVPAPAAAAAAPPPSDNIGLADSAATPSTGESTVAAAVQKTSAENEIGGDDSTNANSVVVVVSVDKNKNHHHQLHNHHHHHHKSPSNLLRVVGQQQDKASGSKRKSSDLDQCPDSSKNLVAEQFPAPSPGCVATNTKGDKDNNNEVELLDEGEVEEEIAAEVVQQQQQQMETDDCMDNDNIPDSDSGIENMETEESQEVPAQLKQKPPPMTLRQDIEIRVARVLNANWGTGGGGGSIVVKDEGLPVDLTADDEDLWQADDFMSRLIAEIITLYYEGVLTKSSSTQYVFEESSPSSSDNGATSSAATPSSSAMNDDEATIRYCPRPTLISFSLPRVAALDYLIRCYDLCRLELDDLGDQRQPRANGALLLPLFERMRLQLIDYALLILDGSFAPKADPNNDYPLERSPLLQLLYENSVDSAFLQQLVAEAYKRPPIFLRVFKPLLHDLYRDQQIAIVSKNLNMQPLQKLHELTEIVIEGNVRPICGLVTTLRNFHPVLSTPFPGRELAKVSFLGPFLSLSIFLQENPKFADRNLDAIVELGHKPVQTVSGGKWFDSVFGGISDGKTKQIQIW